MFWKMLDVFTSGKLLSLLMDQAGNCFHGLAATTDSRGWRIPYPTLEAAWGGTTKTPELPRGDTAASTAMAIKTIPLQVTALQTQTKRS